MISYQGLTVGYGRRLLIENADTAMMSGRLVALLGRNGAGKSSLLRATIGLDKPVAGNVTIAGCDISAMTAAERARSIAAVTTERIRIANLRCDVVVGMGRAPYTGWAGSLSRADRIAVGEALEAVDMQSFASHTMDSMSDGECQRVMIARALAQDTPAMVLDEPTSFLDLPNRYELCLLLKRLAAERGKCVLFSTHELDIALTIADDIALIDTPDLIFGPASTVAASGAIERLFSSPNLAANMEGGGLLPTVVRRCHSRTTPAE